MTGPEHYLAAEQLLEQAAIDARDPMRKYAEDANVIAAAQVHATLALTAANALAVAATQPPQLTDAGADWREVLKPVDLEAAS